MIYSAILEKIGDEVEEEVSVLIQGERLTCFASYMPYPTHIGEVYQVELIASVFGDYIIEEAEVEFPSICRIGEGYSYLIVGILTDGRIDCGSLSFDDDAFSKDFGSLRGKMVSWKVDRLDICFLE
ncbi:hypothetical protein [Rhizobium sp. BR 249]|uniref:hypothetical protein n=1 Tax=Rhizobium sp. BR 249 TaxID=3040011 RepID=UPI0039BF16AA